MAYNAINNTVFAYKAVGDGSTVAQLNDNIEDTRARIAQTFVGQQKVAWLAKNIYSSHAQQAVGVVNFETSATTTIKPTYSTITNPIDTGAIDVSNLVFGDRAAITFGFDFDYSLSSSTIGPAVEPYYTSSYSGSTDVTAIVTLTIDEGLSSEIVATDTITTSIARTGSTGGTEILTDCGAPDPSTCSPHSPSRWTAFTFDATSGTLSKTAAFAFTLLEDSATTAKLEVDVINTPTSVKIQSNIG